MPVTTVVWIHAHQISCKKEGEQAADYGKKKVERYLLAWIFRNSDICKLSCVTGCQPGLRGQLSGYQIPDYERYQKCSKQGPHAHVQCFPVLVSTESVP
jgi:hypothetical protein